MGDAEQGALVRRVETSLRGAERNGRAPLLFRRAWLPESPWAVVLLVHGYAEHSGRYEELGAWLAERGIAVHAYDQRGHGLSSGVRCHVDAFGDYLDDLDCVLTAVRDAHRDLPSALVGHSMGGLVVCAYLADRRPPVQAAATSGALLMLGAGVSRARITAARFLRSLLPRLAMGSGLDLEGLSRDPEVVKRYVEDPLIVRTMTASLAAEILTTIPHVAARAVEVQVPVLMLHGEADPLCPCEGSRAFYGGLHVPGSAFRSYPGLRHEIFNEPERETIYRDLYAWLQTILAPGRPLAETA
ncbi:MAG TPA: lysophospholipase [Myxococcota bacterium]|nr:lysophospholipase [Myxococcota bacterium]